MNYVLSVLTDKHSYYGGSIKATNVDEADEVAFLILNKLQQEGFKNILSVEAIDYYTFKGSLPLPESRKLFNNIAFHRLSHDNNVSPDFLDGLIKYFENTEEYEKCSIILKKKKSLLQRV